MAAQQGPDLQRGPSMRPESDKEDVEEDLLKWIIQEDAVDLAAYAEIRASYIRLTRIRREKAAIYERMKIGGRARKRRQRTNTEHHQRILDDFFGTPEVTIDGVVHEAILARQSLQSFCKRFRMGDILFSRLLLEIQHKETGHPECREKTRNSGLRINFENE